MGARQAHRPRPPLNERMLEELALAYLGRFATSRAKLRAYLARKIRERGWAGEREPDLAAIADRFVERGYIDDSGFALGKAQGLAARGYGKRRLLDTLRSAGIEAQDSAAAREHSDAQVLASALRFAERRRIGPFASGGEPDRRQREKAIAAMVRAGHSFALARTIVSLPPGAVVDLEQLAEQARFTDA